MKKLIKKVLNPIKKVVRGVGGFFGRVMNKLGPLGMIGMMFAMPYLSNFWATMGNAIGGTATGGTAVAEVGKAALQEATKKGLVEAGSKAAQNVALEAGKEAAKKSLLKEGSGRFAAKVASKYASGTGQATGLFAGGTASKALGYALKTLHNTASLGMNIFNTVTGAVSGALDFVSGGSLTKLGNWVGDRFGDFQTRMGMATGEGYKKRLGTRLSNGDLTDSFLETVKNSKHTKGVYAQYSNLYPEGVYTPPAETLISENLPSLRDQIESGTLTADASGKRGPVVELPPDDTQQDISSLLDKNLSKAEAITERDAYVRLLEKEGSLKALETAEQLRNADFGKWGDTDAFNRSLEAPSLLEKTATGIKEFFVGGENVKFNPIYETSNGKIALGVDNKAIPTGRYQRSIVDVPNVIEKTSSAAGDAVANLPKRAADQYGQNWLDRKLDNVPEYKKVINYASEIPGITYGHDSRDDFTTEIPRSNEYLTANNYNNLNNNIYSANPFAAMHPDRINIDYGQGGIYGSG